MSKPQLLALAVCCGIVGVFAASDRSSARTLAPAEMSQLRGGATTLHYCCKVQLACTGTDRTCSDPMGEENPNTPAYMLCANRTQVVTDTPNKACLGFQSGTTCTYDGLNDCKVTRQCSFNFTTLACEPSGSMATITVPATCAPDCP